MKIYYERHGIGTVKYTVSFHDGKKTHEDGSAFYDIKLFRNKKTLHAFIAKLESDGYRSI